MRNLLFLPLQLVRENLRFPLVGIMGYCRGYAAKRQSRIFVNLISVSQCLCGKSFLILMAFLCLMNCADAQVEVGLSLESRSFMKGESVALKVVVRNESDTPLVFNEVYRNAEMFVAVYRTPLRSDPTFQALDREFVIMPEDDAEELVELTSLGNLYEAGGYAVQVQVRYDGNRYTSRPLAFDIVQGIELASLRRSLSGYAGRKIYYSLRYCSRDGSEYAFLVVSDPDKGITYGTLKLGPIVRIHPPAMKFDADGSLVVVHQSGRERFSRSVIRADFDGCVLESQSHLLEDGTPFPRETVR